MKEAELSVNRRELVHDRTDVPVLVENDLGIKMRERESERERKSESKGKRKERETKCE